MLSRMSDLPMYASLFLIGAALALAGGVGVFLPPGHRALILLSLLAGTGVGIAGLALGSASVDVAHGDDLNWWHVFFASSVAGFTAVTAGLIVAWRRARPSAGQPAGQPANE